MRIVERFTRASKALIPYEVTFVDPVTWTAPRTAALDPKARPDGAGVFACASHEGNYGLRNVLPTARYLERTAGSGK